MPDKNKEIERPSASTASFSSGYSLDQSLWQKKDDLVKLKIDGIKEKNEARNFYLTTLDQYCFALYIAIAAFLGGIFTNGQKIMSDFPFAMYSLTICFFLGILASIFRLRILREAAEIAKDFETRGLIYYLAGDEIKAKEYFDKSKETNKQLGQKVIFFANILTSIYHWSLLIGIFLMAFISFQLIYRSGITSLEIRSLPLNR